MEQYQKTTHTSTSLFMLMFGRQPKPSSDFSHSYQAQLRAKSAEVYDLVETNIAQARHNQKEYYDRHAKLPSFKTEDLVWLSMPTAGKLQPKWEGKWRIKTVKMKEKKLFM